MNRIVNTVRSFFREHPKQWARFLEQVDLDECFLNHSYARQCEIFSSFSQKKLMEIDAILQDFATGLESRREKVLDAWEALADPERILMMRQTLMLHGTHFNELITTSENDLERAEWILDNRDHPIMMIAATVIRKHPITQIVGRTKLYPLQEIRRIFFDLLHAEFEKHRHSYPDYEISKVFSLHSYKVFFDIVKSDNESIMTQVANLRKKIKNMNIMRGQFVPRELYLLRGVWPDEVFDRVLSEMVISEDFKLLEQLVVGKTNWFINFAHVCARAIYDRERFASELWHATWQRMHHGMRSVKHEAFRLHSGMELPTSEECFVQNLPYLEALHDAIDRFEAEIWNGGKTTLSAEERDMLNI